MDSESTIFLNDLSELSGIFEGAGVNHEAEAFHAIMAVRKAPGKGVLVWFRASGRNQVVFHEEFALIGLASDQALAMTSSNTNIPVTQYFTGNPATNSCVFQHGDFTSDHGFRETVTLTIKDIDQISYSFAWAMPNEPMQERSSASLHRTPAIPNDCPFAFG